jgi:hypothetical protein
MSTEGISTDTMSAVAVVLVDFITDTEAEQHIRMLQQKLLVLLQALVGLY